ncbi:protein AHNAK2 [Ctenodactylus gundi]
MCDCFHAVLPTWPGAPGSVSGRQLQPGGPDVETEDRSVTEGPLDETVRPRPQGSSPVYEYSTESAGFGVQVDAPGRRVSSGRRRSWWKRDSGDSRTFSSMSHPEETTEVTLKTEVEVGASGYSVTGGGDQGIFVKQVLKDSSAAKLFSLREGDQLLSATIFFDDIKYEDALKILQYSEPYRVQFQIKRKLPGAGDQGGAAKSAADPTGGTGKQDKEIPGGCVETPTKMLEADGDRERLLEKPRGRRGRRPRERLSWPKFQAIRTTRGLAPRRSHSSSEAYERGDTRDLSPTSTDTEAQPQVERQELKAELGSQRSRRFLNLRFKLGSGQGPSSVRQKDREAQGGLGTAGLPEHSGSQDEGPQDAGATASGRREDRAPGTDAAQTLAAQQAALPADTGLGQGAPGDREGEAARRQRKKKQVKAQEEATGRGETRTHVAPGRSWEAEREELQSRESGAARLSPQDPAEEGSTRAKSSEFRVRIRHLKTPKFQCPLDESLETKADSTGRGTGDKAPRTFGDEAGIQAGGTGEADGLGDTGSPTPVTGPEKGTKHRDTNMPSNQDPGVGERDSERWEVKTKVPKFKMPSFGWSPQKAGPPRQQTHARERAQEPLHWPEAQLDSKGPTVGLEGPQLDFQGAKSEMNAPTTEVTLASVEVDIQTPRADLEGDVALRGREVATKDSKFKVPKFKMPSLGMSVPGKPAEPSQEASASQAEDDVALPSIQAAVKTSEFNVQVLSTDREVKVDHAGVLITEGQLPSRAMGGSLKGDLTEAHMPKVDIKGPQGEVSTSTVEMALPSVDTRAPCTKLEGELPLGDKGVAAKDSKLKMTKFKMPSFSVSTPGKTRDATLEVSVPEVMALTSTQDGIKMPTVDWQSTSTNMDIKKGQVVDTVPEEKLPIVATGTGQKGHMPKVQMPSIKMPRVELKGPQLDKKGPKVDMKVSKGEDSAPNIEVTGPSVDTDIQAPCAKLGGDLALKDREMVTRDSKFKMPKFKMPSFGVSDLSKSTEASLEVSARTAEVDMMLPSVQGHVKTPDLSMQLPSTDTGIKTSQVRMTLPVGQVPEEVLPKTAAEMGQKGHLPKVEIPSIKTPKVGLEGPHLHIKGSRVDKDRAVSASTMAVALPSLDVTIQEPRAKLEGNMALEDTEVARKDRKFKMPKFKMPSFGVSIPTKSTEPSQEVLTPDIKADEAQPSVQGDIRTPELSVQVTSGDVEVKLGQAAVALPETQLPEGDLSSVAADASLKGHLPEVLMPSIKMPKVDLKSSQVNIKGTKMDVKSPKSEVSAPSVDVMLPSIDMDTQAPGARLEGNLSSGDKEVGTKDSKFKMPKFKMPSFGVSVPSKSTEASLEVATPRVEVDMTLPPLEGDVKTADVSVKVPSADLEVKTGQVVKTVPEGQVLEEQLRVTAAETGLKGHLPKVKMPSITMPQVDMKGPQLALQGRKVDMKAPKDEVSTSTMEVALPSVEVDIQASRGQVESDLAMGDKEVAIKESKFKMPKVKMPSFGVSIPSKSTEPSLEVSAPEVEGEVTLPSVQGDIRTPALSAQVPSADMEIKMGRVHVALPEGHLPVGGQAEAAAGAGLKGHLPKVQMPSVKMPRVDMKAPKVDVKGPKGEVSASAAEAVLLSLEVDSQAPGAQLEGDLAVGQKEVATRDSKFKMPKFKMPSFGVSAPGKTTEASVEVSAPEIKADVALPSIQGDIRTPELSVQVPSGDVEVKLGQAAVALPETQLPEGDLSSVAADASLKGHLPEVPMPSIKMPKVDLKSSQVNIKGTKMDVKSPKSEVSAPSVDVMLPSVDMDTQAPGVQLEGDLSSGDKEVGTKDSKFKMPKFKMPSFRLSAPSKSLKASLEGPKLGMVMTPPSLHYDIKTPEASLQHPSVDPEVKVGQVGVILPEAQLPEGELPPTATGTGLKGHLPKLQMPSMKMPMVDLRGPQLDIRGPKVDVKSSKGGVSTPATQVVLSSMEMDIPPPDASLEGDLALGNKEVAAKDSTFKMPKLKMPSFGVSAPGKLTEASLEVSAPKVKAKVALPCIHIDKSPEPSVRLPAADVELKEGQAHRTLPEGQLLKGALPGTASGMGPRGHLPKVQTPSVAMPPVDLNNTQPDIKGPFGLSGFSSGSLDLTCGPAPSVLLDSDSVTLTRAHPPALGSPAVPGVAPGASGGAPAVAALADPECSEAPLGGDLPCAQPDGQLGPVSPVFHIRLTFPKFHKPKFGVLVPVAPIPESGCPSEEPGWAQSVVPEQGPDSSAEGAPVCPLLSSQPSPPRVRVSTGLEGHLGPPVGTAPVEGSGRGGQGSPFKRPRFKRPSFSWSPKKQAGHAGDADLEDPTVSLTADPGRETTPPTTQDPHGDVHPDLLPSKTRSSGTSRRPGLAMPRLAFPKLKVPKGRAALSQDEDIAGEWEATDRAGLEGGGGVPATSEGPPEGEGTLPQLLHAHTPSASLSTAEGKVSYPVADLPLHRQEPDVGGGCQGLGLGVFSGSQPHGLEPAPSSGDPGSALGKQSEAPCAPGPELGASMSSDKEATERELPASVLRLPSAGALGTDPRPSEVRVRPAPGPPPLSALAEPHASPDPAEAGRPEGPVTLRASRTDVPSRASVVSAPGPWEDSVRSLTFPRLQVPRFSFPSPGPEPDVFFPIVAAGPGVQPTRREASRLPEGPGVPQEPPPGTSGAPSECQVSKARVHVSGPLGASRAVLAGRRETREGAEPESPEAGSARIVRESEVPGSAIQTPAFGFSLLRGRVPEAPAQAGVGRAAQAPGPQGAPATLPGEASPDSAEPFEAICARAGAPGAPTLAPEAPSGPRLAESGSDEEEPPEILEFPPEDSAEAAGVPEGRPGGRPAPGTLWAWLPRIGFSSAGETSVGARGDAGNRAPVQTQPAPRPDQEPAPRPEKASWLRLPRLGFASAPTKTTRGPEDQAGRARQELVTFFDARESLSPEEGKEGEAAQGAGGSEGRWRPPRERGGTGAGAGEPQGNEGRLGDGPRAGHGTQHTSLGHILEAETTRDPLSPTRREWLCWEPAVRGKEDLGSLRTPASCREMSLHVRCPLYLPRHHSPRWTRCGRLRGA